MPTVPVATKLPVVLEMMDETAENPSLEVATVRVELEVVTISPRENIEVEQVGVATEDPTDDLPAALKKGILNALISTRKLLKKEQIIPQELIDARP